MLYACGNNKNDQTTIWAISIGSDPATLGGQITPLHITTTIATGEFCRGTLTVRVGGLKLTEIDV